MQTKALWQLDYKNAITTVSFGIKNYESTADSYTKNYDISQFMFLNCSNCLIVEYNFNVKRQFEELLD